MKYIYIWLLLLFLSSCFFNKDENVDKAKKELWVINNEVNVSGGDDNSRLLSDESLGEKSSSNDSKKIIKEDKLSYEVKYLTEEKFLELDSLDSIKFPSLEIELTWKTLVNVDEISVKFLNKESSYPSDNYVLQKFKSWDDTFLYRAYSKYQTIDYWENQYIFIAKSWDKTSEFQLIINNIKEEKVDLEEKVNFEEKTDESENDLSSLPTIEKQLEIVSTWEWEYSNSNIDWLNLTNTELTDLTCDTVSDYLLEKITSYYWWNSCRNIETDKWIDLYLLRLDWGEYVYEKHYFLVDKWIYWVYELERWEYIYEQEEDKLQFVKDKNNELKENNDNFESLKKVDELIKKM